MLSSARPECHFTFCYTIYSLTFSSHSTSFKKEALSHLMEKPLKSTFSFQHGADVVQALGLFLIQIRIQKFLLQVCNLNVPVQKQHKLLL